MASYSEPDSTQLDGLTRMQDIEKALARYVGILSASAKRTTYANDRSTYTKHLAAAAVMFASLHSDSPLEALKEQVADERHSYGWGFLSGEEGSAAERAFHEFAKLVEAV